MIRNDETKFTCTKLHQLFIKNILSVLLIWIAKSYHGITALMLNSKPFWVHCVKNSPTPSTVQLFNLIILGNPYSHVLCECNIIEYKELPIVSMNKRVLISSLMQGLAKTQWYCENDNIAWFQSVAHSCMYLRHYKTEKVKSLRQGQKLFREISDMSFHRAFKSIL